MGNASGWASPGGRDSDSACRNKSGNASSGSGNKSGMVLKWGG